jgi:hypothetical protein
MARKRAVAKRSGAAPTASSRQGHDYQDLYGWFRALDLLRPTRHVIRVSIEDPSALFFDDVTIGTTPSSPVPPEFIQVKFHVDQAGAYSTKSFIATKSRNGRSLLEKAWDTWLALKDESPNIELVLATTYSWDPNDGIAEHIRRRYALTREFVEGRLEGKAATSRATWRDHLGNPDEAEFGAFLATLRFRVGLAATSELIRWTADVMELLALKHEQEDVLKGARQIHDWIIDGRSDVTAVDMREAIERLDLREPGASPEPAVSLYIHTIVKEPQETAADWEVDWRDYFEGGEWERGHAVHEEGIWNEAMLPELMTKREEIRAATGTRLLRVAGKARLSAWFAVGWTFQRQAGWTLEVDQRGAWWRNDVPAARDFDLAAAVEELAGDAGTLAVGVSVTDDLAGDVRNYLAAVGNPAGMLLLVQPASGLGQAALRGPADAVALAGKLRTAIREAAGGRPKRVLIFYFGPLAGAAFIGATLNAVAGEIQIYEDQVGGYAPSFILKQS